MRPPVAASLLLLGSLAGTATAATTIQGRVVALDTAQPIADATVTVYVPGILSFPESAAVAHTGADGRYSVTLQRQGTAVVIAGADGRAARTHTGIACRAVPACYQLSGMLQLTDGATLSADFSLPASARLSGRLHDAAAPSISGYVYLTPVGTTPSHLGEAFMPNDDGSFAVDRIYPGTYQVWTDATIGTTSVHYLRYLWPDHYCDRVQVSCDAAAAAPIDFGPGSQIDLPIALRRGSHLRVRVVSDGNGLPTYHTGGVGTAQTVQLWGGIDDDGYTQVGPLLPGPVKILLRPDRTGAYPTFAYPDLPCTGDPCDLAAAPAYDVPAIEGTYTLDDAHVLPLRTVRGRVTAAADGQPIAAMRVYAGTLIQSTRGPMFQSTASALTDANGNYQLEGFAAPPLIVRTRANAPGWIGRAWQYEECAAANLFCEIESTYQPLTLDTQPHTTDIDFALNRGAAIGGRVIDQSTGAPLANYAVAVVPALNRRWGRPFYTDALGRFRIEGLAAEPYYLFASALYGYVNTRGTLYPNQPCSFFLQGDPLQCEPSSAQALTPPAGGVIDGLTIVVGGQDVVFQGGFDG